MEWRPGEARRVYLDRIDRMLKYRLEPQLREVSEHPERPTAIAAE